jgi:mRNA interferase MazF
VVARSDIIWADLCPPAGRRPVCVLARDAAIDVLSALTCAPITRTIRGIKSEAEVGRLPEASVISCDTVITVPLDAFDGEPVGRLELEGRVRLDRALRYALDIQY